MMRVVEKRSRSLGGAPSWCSVSGVAGCRWIPRWRGRTGCGRGRWSGHLAHAGVVLPRLLADRLGLTQGLAEVLARAGFIPLRHRGRPLVDAAAAGGRRDRVDRCGSPYPSGGAVRPRRRRVRHHAAAWLDELADRLGANGLPGRRLARALARARAKAWAAIIDRHGGLPAVRVGGTDLRRPADADRDGQPVQQGRAVVVVRLDATVIQAASDKQGAEPNFKGYGFHPLTAWCTNVGDNLAAMLRPGSAGSFTAADHIAVLDAAIAQLPAAWRTDLLVTVDGAGFSHALIDHLTACNTARIADGRYGRRGRRVEYSVGWPVDARTRAAIAQLGPDDWSVALTTDGKPDATAQVVDLTGLLRHAVAGGKADVDLLEGWPTDLRVIARRTPREPGEQAELGQDAPLALRRVRHQHRHRATPVARRPPPHPGPRRGQHQRHQGLRRPPAAVQGLRPQRRVATTGRPRRVLAGRLRLIALDGQLAKAEPKALRFRLLSAPARMVTHARKKILKIPPGWAWSTDLTAAWHRIHALHPA